MSAKFEVTSPATVGNDGVPVSWSVSESATQASPVEGVRGTPSFSAVVKPTADTKFASHEAATLSRPGLGTIEGYVRSQSLSRVGAGLDCQTVLNQLNVDAEFSETFFPEGLLSEYVMGLVGHVVENPPVPLPDPEAGEVWVAGTAPAVDWLSVTYANGLFVAVSNGATVMTSPDGINWTSRSAADASQWRSVTYGNGLFVAVALSGGDRVMTSPDGVTWTGRSVEFTGLWLSVTYANGLFVAVSNGATVMTSPDGINWTSRTAAAAATWSSVTYGNGLFVAVASSGGDRVMTSPDGINWTSRVAANYGVSVVYGNGTFVAVGNGATVMTSPDGINWTSRVAAASNYWMSVAYGNGLFVVVSMDGDDRVMTSPDGINWTGRSVEFTGGWWSVVYANGTFVAVGNSGVRVMTSGSFAPPFTEWEASTDPIVTNVPWRGNIWQALNNLLMLNNIEMVFVDNRMVLRDQGSVVMDLDLSDRPPARTITAVNARQSSDVTYRNAEIRTGSLYSAYDDGNKVYQIETNQYKQDTIVYEVPLKKWDSGTGKMVQYGEITNAPTTLDPLVEATVFTERPEPGFYSITDSNGTPLPAGMFTNYGGKLEVGLNEVNPFSFLLRWNGPATDPAGMEGPYYLHLNVAGTAVFSTRRVVNVRTGADPEIVTDATPYAIDIPFVNTKLQAIRVGAMAGADLCSTTEEITFTLATHKLAGFGVTPGSIFRWDNTYWRIVTCNIGNASVSITARADTTFAQVDEELADLTYGQFDQMWDGHGYKDFRIEPLRHDALPLPLSVTSTIPADETTGIAVDAPISAVLSREVTGTPTIALSPTVAGTSTYDAGTLTVTFTPDNALDFDTEYTVTVTAEGVTPPGGEWSFTTAAEGGGTVEFVAATAGTYGASGTITSISATIPAETQEGDLILLLVGGTTSMGAVIGYTQVVTRSEAGQSATSLSTALILQSVAGPTSAGSTVTVTQTASARMFLQVVVLRSSAASVAFTHQTGTGGAASPIALPAVAAIPGDYAVSFGTNRLSTDGASAWTLSGEWTQLVGAAAGSGASTVRAFSGVRAVTGAGNAGGTVTATATAGSPQIITLVVSPT